MPSSGDADLVVEFGALPAWLGDVSAHEREPWLGDRPGDGTSQGLVGSKLYGGTFFEVTYNDGTTFVVDRGATRVWACWPEPLTLEDTATYFLGPILGFVLRRRGLVCLHASVFVADDRAVAIVGHIGYGKSTTAAAFARLGFSVLSDDVAVLRVDGDQFYVVPSYPQLKLWPDSTAALFGSPDALKRITPTHPTWDKRYVDLTADGFSFSPAATPLAAVYVLQARRDELAAPFIRELSPRERLAALFENTYAAQYVDSAGHAQAFRVLSRLASTVPVRSVTPHSDVARLGRLCEVILADLARRAPAGFACTIR